MKKVSWLALVAMLFAWSCTYASCQSIGKVTIKPVGVPGFVKTMERLLERDDCRVSYDREKDKVIVAIQGLEALFASKKAIDVAKKQQLDFNADNFELMLFNIPGDSVGNGGTFCFFGHTNGMEKLRFWTGSVNKKCVCSWGVSPGICIYCDCN